MALNGLARYTDAEKVVDEGIALACEEADAPTRKTLEKVKLECVMLKEQAFTGAYDLGALYLNRMSASFRRCADYIGPVKVSKLTNGRRGVVTTSAVSAGELLMVQSAVERCSRVRRWNKISCVDCTKQRARTRPIGPSCKRCRRRARTRKRMRRA